MRTVSLLLTLLLATSAACKRETLLDPSIGQVQRVRAGVTVTPANASARAVGQPRRLTAGDSVRTDGDGRALLALDGGAQLVLDHDSAVQLRAARLASLDAGRIWVRGTDAAPEDELLLAVSGGTLHLRGARASIQRTADGVDVAVLAGQVAFEMGSQRGAVHTGESAHLDGTHARVTQQVAFDDWTGGLADDLPIAAHDVAGVGAVAARRPDEVGAPRWPMVMQRLDADVEVRGDLAITTVDQTFFNPSGDTVEGIYSFRTPPGAVLQMFGVDRHGRTVEGVVREREQAAAQYQAQVYVGSTHDPALLEWDAPGQYHARLYPIAPGATRRIRVRYTQWLDPDADGARLYRLPLAGLDTRIGELRVDVDLEDSHATRVRSPSGGRLEDHHLYIAQSDVVPHADVVVELQGQPENDVTAVHSASTDARGGYIRVAVRAPVAAARDARDVGVDLVLVVDHSAATDATARSLEQAFVESVLEQLEPRDQVLVLAGDVTTRALGHPNAELRPATPENRRAIIDALSNDTLGGATDLGAMLAAAHHALRPDHNGAVVYVGDGIATVGDDGLPALRRMLSRLDPHPRLYAIAVGEDPRLDLLTGLAEPAGFAARVSRRSDVARTALDLVAHASRPLVRNFHVDLGSEVQAVYPAEPVDVPAGEPLVVVGRYASAPPQHITVRAQWNGIDTARTSVIESEALDDGEDLRSRWATGRLQHLLARGESRPVIVELGTRFHLITPFTSLYVASEDEQVSVATPSSDVPMRLADLSPSDFIPWVGCAKEHSAASVEAPAAAPATAATSTPVAPASDQSGTGQRHAGSEGRMGPRESRVVSQAYAAGAAGPNGEPSAVAPGEPPRMGLVAPAPPAAAEAAPAAMPRAGGGSGVPFGYGGLGTTGTGVGGGGAGEAGIGALARNAAVPAERARAHAAVQHHANDHADAPHNTLDGESNARSGADAVALPAQPATSDADRLAVAAQHAVAQCSDAAAVSLAERIPLWRERLSAHAGAAGAMEVFRTARRQCELPAWADRVTLLRLMVNSVADVDGEIALYRGLAFDTAARVWVRALVLRALARTGDLARAEELGLGRLDSASLTAALGHAATPAERFTLLSELSRRYPDDVDLSLRLLDAAVDVHATAQVHTLTARLRADPRADARVRTAAGEALLAVGDEAEARRSFSEIVEFAPDDPGARRRLGDIALSHGWADEAYRQFQMLAVQQDDAPDVLLRQAMAAEMAGRIDEAIRLAERVAEQSQPGASGGVSEVAAAWIGVELALASQSRTADADTIQRLRAVWRRSSAARAAGAVRVVLRWLHPDDNAELWLALPGESTRRSDLVADTVNFETTVLADAPASLSLEVRRGATARARGQAELLVVWGEGTDHERIDRVALVLDNAHETYVFSATPTSLADVTPAPTPQPATPVPGVAHPTRGAR